MQRITLLNLGDKGTLAFVRMSGETGEADLHRQSTVTPWLTTLLLKTGRSLEALVLMPDALHPDDYRRLRVWLRGRSESE